MNGLADFVAGGFPLPWNPVYADSGMGDFVWGGFPLPQNPVGYRPSVNGQLPKAPPMPRALIGNGGGLSPDGCGMGYFDQSDMIRGFSGIGYAGNSQSDMIRGFSGMGYAGDSQSDMIRGFSGMGSCCSGCSGGMGALDLENLIPGQTFGINNTYLVGGALLAFLVLPKLMGGGRRR